MIIVTLGSDHAIRHHDAPLELSGDDVFTALNRIETAAFDVQRLLARAGADGPSARWLGELRYALDEIGAPSMSVGDRIWIVAPSGAVHGYVECLAFGWSDVQHDTDLYAALEGRKVYECITPKIGA